jgi:hypothetical protein
MMAATVARHCRGVVNVQRVDLLALRRRGGHSAPLIVGDAMTGSFKSLSLALIGPAAALGLTLSLAGCTGSLPSLTGTASPPPPSGPLPPPSFQPEDIVGRWGLGAYHRPEDRARTEAAARAQCTQPYVINRSSVGVSMLGYDNPQVQDMFVKGSYEGKTYIGPTPQPGGPGDREVVSFDGRVLVLKWVESEVAGRYGTMVLVRCGAKGTTKKKKPKTAKTQ